MPLTTQQMDQAMDRHFGFEAADDIEGVLSTLTGDVIHDVVGSPAGPTLGPEGARGFYQQLFADLADGEIQGLRRWHGENFLVDESLWRGRAVGRPFGMEGGNRPLAFRLLHIVEFSDDGLIRRENVWVDFPAIMQQLAAS
ncbi:MAG: ketosteroid isomerase [Gammaproteobacteria bacterium]|nr:MAG: ketosteroid isomerase [Gammaproteobacteria bacterium]